MNSIREAGPYLTWSHPDVLRKDFELRGGGETYGSIAWERKNGGSLATARSSDGLWTFKRIGFLQPHVTVRDVNTERIVARFDAQWNGPGLLHLSDGRNFRWEANFWRAEWEWTDAAGDVVVTFKRNFSDSKREGNAHLAPGALSHARLDILVLLGWYLIILMGEDAATVIHRDLAADEEWTS